MSETCPSPARLAEVGRIVSDLRARFIVHEGYATLLREFDILLHRRRADLMAGRTAEARGIVVVGSSGSGKSTALQRLFRKHPDVRCLDPNRVEADVASFLVPSPATLKSVGLACLTGLGYPLRRDRTAMITWELVHAHLEQRRILFLHLDEVQDLHINRGVNEMQAVVNTLKSLMQNATWPVGLVLSGTPALKQLVNLDPQLSRRLVPVEFAPISAHTHNVEISAIISSFARTAELAVADDLGRGQFFERLVHAGAAELGLTIELIIGAIEEALLRDAKHLDRDTFRRAFRRRSGARDALNPIVSDDWREIDARLLLQSHEVDHTAAPRGRGRR